jgi:BASS family bile acid:Na+ symporter
MPLLRSLLFWLLVSSGIAFVWPADTVGFDPFLAPPALLWLLIVVTMFALGTLVRPDELQPLRSSPWWVVLGVITQVTVMPLAAWLTTKLIPMDPELAAGVILVGCVPGAMASNVLTNTARGSVAYSVSLTSVATILSPLTVPLVLWIVAGARTETSLSAAAVRLAVLVVLPTMAGYLVSRRSAAMRLVYERCGPLLASIALLWIIASVVAANRDYLISVSGILVVALLAINAAGYAAGYSVGRLAKQPEHFRRALTLEVGMQNAGLGTALATSLYGAETIATIPTAAYTFGCMLTGTILAVWWRSLPS